MPLNLIFIIAFSQLKRHEIEGLMRTVWRKKTGLVVRDSEESGEEEGMGDMEEDGTQGEEEDEDETLAERVTDEEVVSQTETCMGSQASNPSSPTMKESGGSSGTNSCPLLLLPEASGVPDGSSKGSAPDKPTFGSFSNSGVADVAMGDSDSESESIEEEEVEDNPRKRKLARSAAPKYSLKE